MAQKRSAPLLPAQSTIGVFAPSSYIDPVKLESGCENLKKMGYKIFVHPQSFAKDHQSAGSPQEKANAFLDLWNNSEINMILAAKGGNRANSFLPVLDFKKCVATQKIYMGFSDSTILCHALLAQLSQPSLFGPMVQSLATYDSAKMECVKTILQSDTPTVSFSDIQYHSHHRQDCTGPALGGTLSMICSLAGTPYLRLLEGSILYLEDTHEELSRLDRMLWQLRQLIETKNVKAILCGQFSECQDTGSIPFGFSLSDILQEKFSDLNIPVVSNLHFGHGDFMPPLPFGFETELSFSGNQAILKF
jgi:muramoyltetrapeptide carboxypeptidase